MTFFKWICDNYRIGKKGKLGSRVLEDMADALLTLCWSQLTR